MGSCQGLGRGITVLGTAFPAGSLVGLPLVPALD